MKAEEFLERIRNDPKENLFPKGTDAQEALNILIAHFLGNDWYIVDPLSVSQVNSVAVLEILQKYPSGSIRMIPKERRKK